MRSTCRMVKCVRARTSASAAAAVVVVTLAMAHSTLLCGCTETVCMNNSSELKCCASLPIYDWTFLMSIRIPTERKDSTCFAHNLNFISRRINMRWQSAHYYCYYFPFSFSLFIPHPCVSSPSAWCRLCLSVSLPSPNPVLSQPTPDINKNR